MEREPLLFGAAPPPTAAAAVATVKKHAQRGRHCIAGFQYMRMGRPQLRLAEGGKVLLSCMAFHEEDRGGLEFSLGSAVVVVGVNSELTLNGKRGVVEGLDGAKGRYIICIEGEGNSKSMHPINLTSAEQPEEWVTQVEWWFAPLGAKGSQKDHEDWNTGLGDWNTNKHESLVQSRQFEPPRLRGFKRDGSEELVALPSTWAQSSGKAGAVLRCQIRTTLVSPCHEPYSPLRWSDWGWGPKSKPLVVPPHPGRFNVLVSSCAVRVGPELSTTQVDSMQLSSVHVVEVRLKHARVCGGAPREDTCVHVLTVPHAARRYVPCAMALSVPASPGATCRRVPILLGHSCG